MLSVVRLSIALFVMYKSSAEVGIYTSAIIGYLLFAIELQTVSINRLWRKQKDDT